MMYVFWPILMKLERCFTFEVKYEQVGFLCLYHCGITSKPQYLVLHKCFDGHSTFQDGALF